VNRRPAARRGAALGGALLIVGLAALIAAPAAAADPVQQHHLAGVAISTGLIPSCKSAPPPQLPGTGASGWFESTPSPLPPPGQAFGPDADTTEFDQYGYAGLSFSDYDLGCSIDDLDPQTAMANTAISVDTTFGNWLLGAAKVVVSADGDVHTWASGSSWQTGLYPIVTDGTRAVHDGLFDPFADAMLLIVVIGVAWRNRGGDLVGMARMILWALVVLTLTAFVTASPTWIPQQVSSLMSYSLSAMDAGFVGPGGQASAAEAHQSLLTQDILFPGWERGEFGSATSATAQQYGGEVLENEALSWSQAAGSPSEISQASQTEESNWETVASQVESSDAEAYSYLQGKAGGRAAAGLITLIAALIVCAFDLLASSVVIIAILAVMVAVILLPGFAVFGLHESMRGLIAGLVSRVGGMLLTGLLYAAAGGIDIRATAALLGSPAIPMPIALLMLLLLPLTLILLMRMARGKPPVPRILVGAASYALLRRTMHGRRSGGGGGGDRGPRTRPPIGPMDDPDSGWNWRLDRDGPFGPPRPALGGGGGGGGGGPRPGGTPPPGAGWSWKVTRTWKTRTGTQDPGGAVGGLGPILPQPVGGGPRPALPAGAAAPIPASPAPRPGQVPGIRQAGQAGHLAGALPAAGSAGLPNQAAPAAQRQPPGGELRAPRPQRGLPAPGRDGRPGSAGGAASPRPALQPAPGGKRPNPPPASAIAAGGSAAGRPGRRWQQRRPAPVAPSRQQPARITMPPPPPGTSPPGTPPPATRPARSPQHGPARLAQPQPGPAPLPRQSGGRTPGGLPRHREVTTYRPGELRAGGSGTRYRGAPVVSNTTDPHVPDPPPRRQPRPGRDR
jgi:hypothetical protein